MIGSYIGVAPDGTTACGNGASGILITGGSSNNTIGNTAGDSAEPHCQQCSAMACSSPPAPATAFARTRFTATTLPGIHLAVGANLNQAAPVLTSVQTVGSNLQISGTLTSQAKKTFTLEFFANSVNEPAGRYFLGSLDVTTTSTGEAAFTFLGPLAPSGATYFTATATDSKDNTSEFSAVLS